MAGLSRIHSFVYQISIFRYSIDIEGTNPVTAINHFTIDSVSDDISVFRSLAEEGLTRISQYTLRVIASDQGKC